MCEEQAKNPCSPPPTFLGAEHTNYSYKCSVGTSNQGGASMGQSIGLDRQRPPVVNINVNVNATRSFEDTLSYLKGAGRATRAGWNGRDQFVQMQVPDKGSKMTQPYLCIRTSDGNLVPWVPSQGDLFARDWALLPLNHDDNPF